LVHTVAPSDAPGGLGTLPARMPARHADIARLLLAYPSFLRVKQCNGSRPDSDRQVRLTSLAQVEVWRFEMCRSNP
jgi:hypothetical protein